MSKLGVHVNQSPTGLGAFLQDTANAGSIVPALFSLDNNVYPDILSKSPQTHLIFRTQKLGADTGSMYQGDPAIAGQQWVERLLPIWELNPANWYAPINEPGRLDPEGLNWLCNFYLGAMWRADQAGVKLCIGEWSTGNPPLEYISIYTPMLYYAASNGHLLGLHEYSLDGPMLGSPLCLRYRQLYAALPADSRPQLMISEAGPDAGYGTGYTGQPYVDVVAAYDAEVMRDRYVLGVALFKLGKGESDMVEVLPALTQYVIEHPTPDDIEPPPAEQWEFDYWDLDGARVEGNPLTLVMNSHHTLRPHAKKKAVDPVQYTLTLEPCPEYSGLVVSFDPADLTYPAGTEVRCEAIV